MEAELGHVNELDLTSPASRRFLTALTLTLLVLRRCHCCFLLRAPFLPPLPRLGCFLSCTLIGSSSFS